MPYLRREWTFAKYTQRAVWRLTEFERILNAQRNELNFVFNSFKWTFYLRFDWIDRPKNVVTSTSVNGTPFIFYGVQNCLFETENCIETVFSFTINLLLRNQFERSDIVLFTVSFLQRIFVSSAKRTVLPFRIANGISFRYNRKIIGPKIDPCGAPRAIGKEPERCVHKVSSFQ